MQLCIHSNGKQRHILIFQLTKQSHRYQSFNTLRPRQNGPHFPDDIFKCIFLNENVWISIKISLNFVPRGPINNIPASVQIMAWRWPGDKPLSEPMMVCLLTHISVTRSQWVNSVGSWEMLQYFKNFVVNDIYNIFRDIYLCSAHPDVQGYHQRSHAFTQQWRPVIPHQKLGTVASQGATSWWVGLLYLHILQRMWNSLMSR